jgi:hypothetical protein
MAKISCLALMTKGAVKNDPIGFIDALNDEANRNENSGLAPLLREAACVIANLMERLGIPEKEGM